MKTINEDGNERKKRKKNKMEKVIRKYIDIDKVIQGGCACLCRSLKQWTEDALPNEEALMNHFTGIMRKQNKMIDFGVSEPVGKTTQIAMLHRRGRKQRDKYGCDLAITIHIKKIGFVKTALFQLKIGEGSNVEIDKKQIDDALIQKLVRPRAFVVYIDKSSHRIRFRSMEGLVKDFSNEKNKTFNTDSWIGYSEWMTQWIICNVGESSKLNDKNSVENLLQSDYLKPIGNSSWRKVCDAETISESNRIGFIPPKIWMICFYDTKNDAH